MRLTSFIAIALCVLLSCGRRQALPYYHTADFTPLWEGEQEFAKDTLHAIGDFRFTDQHGLVFDNRSVKNRIYVANFFFTACPGICPKMTSHLGKVQKTFAAEPDVMIVSHTVMPWADSVGQLKLYAEVNDIDYSRWRLVTGLQSKLYELARRSYYAEEVAGFVRDSTDFVHTEHCLLVDRDGHLRGIYNGTLELEIGRLVDDIHALLAESH
jgi:protein SCO1